MEECFKCGISEQNAKLHNAISDKGIVKVCQRCSGDGDFPVLVRKEASLERADKTAPVGGLIKEREKAFEAMKASRKGSTMGRQDFTLRDLVEKNYKENVSTEKKSWPGAIRNFNWIIMRARRNKGLGQRALAESIGEPEIAVRMAERGTLPKEYVPFLRKLERVLDVNLMDDHPFRLEEHKKMLDFKNTSSNRMTISDVRDMTRKKEVEIIKSKELLEREKVAQEAQQLLDEPEKVEEKKAQSPGFFMKFFSKKEKTSEDEQVNNSDSFVVDKSEKTLNPTSSSPVQNKEMLKLDSTTPGRTKPVSKYRWQK
jgi:ribosome-binding protein aMBF1 (putative translation factor)